MKSYVFKSEVFKCNNCESEIYQCDECKEYFHVGDEVYCKDSIKHLCEICFGIWVEGIYNRGYKEYAIREGYIPQKDKEKK